MASGLMLVGFLRGSVMNQIVLPDARRRCVDHVEVGQLATATGNRKPIDLARLPGSKVCQFTVIEARLVQPSRIGLHALFIATDAIPDQD